MTPELIASSDCVLYWALGQLGGHVVYDYSRNGYHGDSMSDGFPGNWADWVLGHVRRSTTITVCE